MKYGNLIDYLGWRGDITFEQSPLNIVDALAFSILTYIDYQIALDHHYPDGQLTLSEAFKIIKSSENDDYCKWILDRDQYLEFFEKIVATERFANVKVCHYVEKTDGAVGLQFAAMTFLLPEGTVFIAFRGTDNTMAGWKEDFNMSFVSSTPGQLLATEYVNDIASKTTGRLCIGGHSKGGNFSVWAAANINEEYRDRIYCTYNNDGPGFTEEFVGSEKFKAVEDKILSFVPESSIVGVLLCHCDYVTIKSTNLSVLQHDPLSWQIIGKEFVTVAERPKASKTIEQKMSKMINDLSNSEKSEIVEEIFNTLERDSINTTDDIKANIFKSLLVTLPTIITKVQMKRMGKDKIKIGEI